MTTNMTIDPELLNKALEVGGEKTKEATVNRALREFIARREQERLLELFGKLDWDDEYDYKRDRTRQCRVCGHRRVGADPGQTPLYGIVRQDAFPYA